jgi:hypothetical protein
MQNWMRHSLLFVLTRASFALRERKLFLTFISSSFLGVAFALPVSFRQILAEPEDDWMRFGGADVEGDMPETGIGELEGLNDGTDGLGIELARRCASAPGRESERNGTGTGRDVEPMTVDIVESFVEMGAVSATDVPVEVPLSDGEHTDEGEGGSEANWTICCSSSSLTTSTTLTELSTLTPTSSSNSKTLSGPVGELSTLFLTLV